MQVHKSDSIKNLYKRLLVRFILAIFFLFFIIYIFPKSFRMFSPFIMALIVASIANSIVSKINNIIGRINKRFIIPIRTSTLLLNLLIVLILALVMYSLISTVIKEAIGFTSSIIENWPSIVEKFDSFLKSFEWLTNLLPAQLIEILIDVKEDIYEFLQNISKNFLSSTVTTTAAVISRTGSFVLNLLTFLLALFFITADYARISRFIEKHVSKEVKNTYHMLKNSILVALGGYFKSQLILALFAFVFMFISLTIYGQEYAFLIALILGLIDLLPLIGTIAILIPWGIIEFIAGDINKGIFLVLLAIIFFLIRRIIEPKIMGSQTGLHPLLSLLGIYIGLKFSGALGAILGPITIMLIVTILKSGLLDNTIADLKAVYNRISALLKSREDNPS